MQKVINKGFTLIELLVVIAIIGILAAIVLVSLGNARQKGADAGIQGNLDSIRTQAEVYSSNNSSSYGSQATSTGLTNAVCGSTGMWADPTISTAVKSAAAQSGLATLQGTASSASICGSSSGAWAVAVVKKADNTLAWCVDSSGRAKDILVSTIDAASGEPFQGCN